jgi:hypothetical protein
MRISGLLVAFTIAASTWNWPACADPQPAAAKPSLDASVKHYVERFGAPDLHRQLTNDAGKGVAELKDLRNLRTVLTGVLYRSGGNNKGHKPPRPNDGPLPPEAFDALCNEGFSQAVYLYKKGYVPTHVDCKRGGGEANSFFYDQKLDPESPKTLKLLLALIHDRIVGEDHRPILVHCYNGWHASGFVSAVALRQFCGFSGDDAVRYWKDNSYPLDPSNPELSQKLENEKMSKLRAFTPLDDLKISTAQKALICPQAGYPKSSRE